MSDKKRVQVVYPALYSNIFGDTRVTEGRMKGYFYTPEKKAVMWLHGPTVGQPDLLLVEDDSGFVHVVNKNIVKELDDV